MRQLVLFAMLFHINSSTAQSYTPFPASNAIWVNHYYSTIDCSCPPPGDLVEITNFCVNGEDTLINLTLYTKINYCNGPYKGALRDNGGQVYFVPKDSLTEFLLYDFTVSVGDSIPYPLGFWDYYDTLYVESIDSFIVNGNYRTIIHFDNCPDVWTEGIGCSAGLFMEPYVNNNVSGGTMTLDCMSYNDTLYNAFDTPGINDLGVCNLYQLSLPSSGSLDIPVFSPNPTSGEFFISGIESEQTHPVFITNQFGQRISIVPQQSEGKTILSLTNQPNGIYFVFVSVNGTEYIGKIVKQ